MVSRKLFTFTFLLTLLPFPIESLPGYASCFGDYATKVDGGTFSGLGSYMTGEDFTYGSAICAGWQITAAGACFLVKCTSGKTGGMACVSTTVGTTVKIIDSLGSDTCGSSSTNQIFDLSTVPFGKVASDGAKCSGEFYIDYQAVTCNGPQGGGLVTGGVRIGVASGQCDPWRPPFWIDNVGGAGALFAVYISTDHGTTWLQYERFTANGARWNMPTSAPGGVYAGFNISFKLQTCALAGLPSSCTLGEELILKDVLPSTWCPSSPCPAASWTSSTNFNGGGSGTTAPTTAAPTKAATATAVPTATTTKAATATTVPTATATTAPVGTATPGAFTVSCPAASGTYTAGATTNTIAKGANFPTALNVYSCGTLQVPIQFSVKTDVPVYLVVDVVQTATPWGWYGSGTCLISGSGAGTALVTATISATPQSPAGLSVWLVNKTRFDQDSSTAYQTALTPGQQTYTGTIVASCGTTAAPVVPTATTAATTKTPTIVATPTTKVPTIAPTVTTRTPTIVATATTAATTKSPTIAATATTKSPTIAATATTKTPTIAATATTKTPTIVATATTAATTQRPTTAPTVTPTTPSTSGPTTGGLSGWMYGRASNYQGMDNGNCGYKTIPSASFPYRYIAAPNEAFYNKGASCGACYEVVCNKTSNPSTYPCKSASVIVKITDNCPVAGNEKWCSGDMVHFDLSQEAFAVLADLNVGIISNMNYRRVPCPYSGPIKVVQAEGVSTWWIKFWLYDVGNYGAISKVELQNSGSTGDKTTWYVLNQPDGDGGWALSPPAQLVPPLSVRVTDSTGAQITATNLITTIATGTTNSFAGSTVNFKSTAPAEASTPSESNFMKQGIYILVACLIIVVLLVALFLVLRSRARDRGTSVSEYVRASIAPTKEQRLEIPMQSVASQSELTTTPVGGEAETQQLNPAAASSPLSTAPQEWEQRHDATSGQNYYYNNVTGVTQWEVPDGSQA